MSKGNFRCCHCGDYFDLDKDEQEIYEDGFFSHEPDCCQDCWDMISHPSIELEHSDADPGL